MENEQQIRAELVARLCTRNGWDTDTEDRQIAYQDVDWLIAQLKDLKVIE